MSCIPLAAGGAADRCQLSEGLPTSSFLWSLGVTLDLQKVMSVVLSLGMSLVSKGLFITARNINSLSWLTGYLNGFFLVKLYGHQLAN